MEISDTIPILQGLFDEAGPLLDDDEEKAINKLIYLAEKYITIEAKMPEKVPCDVSARSDEYSKACGQMEMRERCILAFLKMAPTVEDIKKKIEGFRCVEWTLANDQRDNEKSIIKRLDDVSKSIHALFVRGIE